MLRLPLVFTLLLATAGVGRAQADAVKAAYAKRETYITMRDGTRLFTAIYAPRDTTRSYPILLLRTPYSIGPYGESSYPTPLGPSPAFTRDGYIFVYQDVRGRFMSEGVYQYMTPHLATKRGPKDVDESSDTYDTIQWLLANVPRHNGRVGSWGISAPGFFAAAGMIDAHPALRAVSPQAPLIDWFMGDDRHKNGALTLAQTFNFISGFDRPREGPTTSYPPRRPIRTADGYAFHLDMGPLAGYDSRYFEGSSPFWNELMAHDTYDEFWQRRSLQRHLKDIRPAVLLVGGWYDAEDPLGPLEAWRAMDRMSPGTTRTLVVGPWSHGGWSYASGDGFQPLWWGTRTGPFYRDSIELPFFACHLKDRCGTPLPRAVMFETGAGRWRTLDAWPPPEAVQRTVTLQPGGRIALGTPAAEGRLAASDGNGTGASRNGSFVEWISDPSKPVPYTQATSFGYWPYYPVEDQRFASRRADVVTFRSEPLTAPLTLAGPTTVRLTVSTSGTDADYIVKLIDVYPDDAPDSLSVGGQTKMGDYQLLLRGDVMRAKFRRSFTTPEPMVPDQPASIELTLQDLFHTLQPGHRLMVQVQSTWFPLIDRNPGTFTKITTATAGDFRPTRQRVYVSADLPSSLQLTVLP